MYKLDLVSSQSRTPCGFPKANEESVPSSSGPPVSLLNYSRLIVKFYSRPPSGQYLPDCILVHLGSPSSHSTVQRPLFFFQRCQVPPWPAVVNGGLAIHPLRAHPKAQWRQRPGHERLPDRSRKEEAKCQASRQRSLELRHARCVQQELGTVTPLHGPVDRFTD